MKKIGDWAFRILVGISVALVLGVILMGLIPVPQDEVLTPENYGVGASGALSAYTGLDREFPAILESANNPSSAEKVALGYLLFFDPILSAEDDIACATCHHPDMGFSDGLPQSIGRDGEGVGPERSGGVGLARNASTLWNVAYTNNLFWDGRVNTLEDQALVPLHDADEMAAVTTVMIAELQAIPEYVALFDAAFGGGADAITQENIVNALAAFERTLISDDSPFDRFAAGELDALTPQQQRGFNLFRSAATRCFECHTTPTFQTESVRLIGVPDYAGLAHDSGRAAVSSKGMDGGFKVPTLRNIALTAPYMHNGVFATLEEVIAFYAAGGGNAAGLADMDPFMQGFDLSEQETEDLIAFLFALTDESGLIEIPTSVPSGLPVVPSLENPFREIAASYNIGSGGQVEAGGEARVLVVESGQRVQDVVDMARPGDTVMIPYGTYHERVVVNLNGITIHGIPNDDGEYPIFDGQKEFSEAFISSGNDFEIAYLSVIDYTDNGILVEGITNLYIHHIYAENTGTYGLYPVQSTNVLIEDCEVTLADDAGIYAGQSEDVVIRNNVVYANVLGIEVENTLNTEIYSNHAYDNTNGILVVILPQLTSKVSLHTKVFDNIMENNNHVNFAKPNTAAALMPAGSGMVILGGDYVDVYNNTFTGNNTAAIGILDLRLAFNANEIDVGSRPEHVHIHDNVYKDNGLAADAFIADMGLSGVDIIWDVSGVDVRIDDTDINVFPSSPPSSKMPGFFYNIYWHFWHTLINW